MIDKKYFEDKITEKYKTKTAFVEAVGIELSSLGEWFSRGVIPSKRITDVLGLLGISTEDDISRLLGLPTIETSYRARYRDLTENLVNDSVKDNTKFLSKTFFSLFKKKKKNDIQDLVSKINGSRDAYLVANFIRQKIDITDSTPLDCRSINYILEKFGINVFFIPFDSFGLKVGEDENQPLAFTSRLGTDYLVICDSDRTYDEANFDLAHELVHVFTGLLGDTVSHDDEKFIDRVTEELVYPKLFIEREMGSVLRSKKVTKRSLIDNGFRHMIASYDFFAPRGIAKTLFNLEILSKDQPVYKWMINEEHDFFLKHHGETLSQYGRMDFEFSDSYLLEDFINKRVISSPKKYPFFYVLCRELVNCNITPRAFSKIFGVDSGEADELRKVWKGKFADDLGI